jgi:dihydroxyacid dehydratase/phosphogluconate dehydratase
MNMRLAEFAIAGVKTPDEIKIDALNKNKEAATNAVKVEKNRQKLQKSREMQKSAQKAIQTIKPIAPK